MNVSLLPGSQLTGRRAVVLLSGGVDSAMALAWAGHEFQYCALVFDYGQL